jgi:hypothetical protein
MKMRDLGVWSKIKNNLVFFSGQEKVVLFSTSRKASKVFRVVQNASKLQQYLL